MRFIKEVRFLLSCRATVLESSSCADGRLDLCFLNFPCSSPKANLGGLASRIKLTEDIRTSRMVQESCVLTSLSSKYLYCPNCGTRLSEIILREAQFCPYCGTAFVDLLPASNLMPAQNGAALSSSSEALAGASPTQVIVDVQESSSLGRTILTGFAWLLLLGWIPVIGPLIAGYKTGSLAGKATRGLLAGFAVGVLSTLIVVSLVAVLGGILGDLLFGIKGAGIGALLSGTIVGALLLIYGTGDILACALGGLIGGTIKEGRIREQMATAIPLHSVNRANYFATPGSSNKNGSLPRNDYQELVFSFLQSKAGMLLLRAVIESIFA